MNFKILCKLIDQPCRIEAEALKDAADWIDDNRKFWEESFYRLDAYLKTRNRLVGKSTNTALR